MWVLGEGDGKGGGKRRKRSDGGRGGRWEEGMRMIEVRIGREEDGRNCTGEEERETTIDKWRRRSIQQKAYDVGF